LSLPRLRRALRHLLVGRIKIAQHLGLRRLGLFGLLLLGSGDRRGRTGGFDAASRHAEQENQGKNRFHACLQSE
jgi:hypothetical protein